MPKRRGGGTVALASFGSNEKKSTLPSPRPDPPHEDAARLSVIFIYAAHIRLLRFTRCYLVKFRIIYGYKSDVAN
jgi:hypothetical protein